MPCLINTKQNCKNICCRVFCPQRPVLEEGRTYACNATTEKLSNVQFLIVLRVSFWRASDKNHRLQFNFEPNRPRHCTQLINSYASSYVCLAGGSWLLTLMSGCAAGLPHPCMRRILCSPTNVPIRANVANSPNVFFWGGSIAATNHRA